jgi:CRISPR/Cas system-associated protein Cas10 (large subunit of type III CRISPR-Cas system)
MYRYHNVKSGEGGRVINPNARGEEKCEICREHRVINPNARERRALCIKFKCIVKIVVE